MTVAPVTFATAAPIAAIEKVERLRRRPKSPSSRRQTSENGEAAQSEPIYAAVSAEELASDETRDALINIRLGG